jgi:ketosteroid isomerase-like protein
MWSNLKAVLAGTLLATVVACAAEEPATEEPAAMTEEPAATTAEPAATTAADVTAISDVREMEAEGVGSGDVEAGVAAYADDVVFMAPDEPAMNGKDAIRTWLTGLWEQFDLVVDYTSSHIVVSGDWAMERYAGNATFTPKAGGEPVVEQIKGIHIYNRQSDGAWRITHDIWNTDAPAPM